MQTVLRHNVIADAVKKHAADTSGLSVIGVDLTLRLSTTAAEMSALVNFQAPESAISLTDMYAERAIVDIINRLCLGNQLEIVITDAPSFTYDKQLMATCGEVTEFTMAVEVRKKAPNYAASFDH